MQAISSSTGTSDKGAARPGQTPLRWSGLRFRTTVSYALTTLVAVLALEILLGSTIWALLTYGGLADDEYTRSATQTAQVYALAAAVQAGGPALDPQTTFAPDQPGSIALDEQTRPGGSLAVPYVAGNLPAPQDATFLLLIDPRGRVLASSYSARYPAGGAFAQMLPGQAGLIAAALAGRPGRVVASTRPGRVAFAAQPVRSRAQQTIGAVYIQVPEFPGGVLLQGFASGWIVSGVFWVLLMLPLGVLFGLFTTRGLVRRLRRLVAATTRFADGDLGQRVPVSRRDEVGQLEEQFNRMAEQLVTSIGQLQALAGQNARLAERSRIARDLHDSVKQQVFAVTMQLGAALARFDQDREATRGHLREAEDLAYHVQQELATLIQELRPLALQDKRLTAALQDYLPAWSRQHGIAAALRVEAPGVLPPAVEEALWRVAQEALSNVARHSGARTVEVALTQEAGQVRLSIADDGQGFDGEVGGGAGPSWTGVGLHSMWERMTALGGTVRVESHAGAGTRVQARCAVAPPDGSAADAQADGLLATPVPGRKEGSADGGAD